MAQKELNPIAAETRYLEIIGANMPQVIDPAMRNKTRKAWAAGVRQMLKAQGVKDVSVTTPNYSMASSISIHLPTSLDKTAHKGWENDFDGHNVQACRFCKTREYARLKIERMILAAFPDLDDRSDYMSDYFRFCFSVK